MSALGIARPRIEDGGVSWEGDARSLMRANLWLRTASRVVVRIARFEAKAFYELEKRAKRVEWARFVGAGASVDFRVTAHKSKLYHSEAIAERLRDAARRDWKAESREQLFIVRVLHDEFTISADSSGALLHMRGYRQAIAKAPLRETLAAALLLGAEWNGDTPVLDPFCGSGTIPIEAALIARRIAPGRGRRFAFMDWPEYDSRAWRELLDDANTGVLAGSPVAIRGADRDAGAIESSRANAERAGVAGDVEFAVSAVSGIDAAPAPGMVATNPPYGVRVGDKRDVRNLYARLGQVLRENRRGWRVALYTPEVRLAAELGLRLKPLFRTSNGGIRVAALTGTVAGCSVVNLASARFLQRYLSRQPGPISRIHLHQRPALFLNTPPS